MQRLIFHVDVNSAFLSWEAARRAAAGEADLRLIPSAIGGDRDKRTGIILAKSIPAKAFGVTTGEPVGMALRKCPQLVLAPPDFRLYSKNSKAFIAVCRRYAPVVEQVSIDECFLDMTGTSLLYPDPIAIAHTIKDTIFTELGFTVNVGIAPNKLLAKMASDFEKPDKTHTLFPDEIRQKMWPLPVSELYMAGRSSVEILKKLEINTIGDLARSEEALIELHLKSHGRMLWEFANGIGDDQVQSVPDEAKGIGNSTTLAEDAVTYEEAEKVLKNLAESVGIRLKKAGKKAGMLSVEIRYFDFRNASHQMQLEKPSAQPEVLLEKAGKLFQELWSGEPVRLLGIRTSKLVEESAPEQLTLFDLKPPEEPDEKHKKLKAALEELNSRFGKDTVIKGTLYRPKKK